MTSTDATVRVAIVGLGRNARHNHYPALCSLAQKMPVQVVAVVDLKSKVAETAEYLSHQALQPLEIIACPDSAARSEKVHPEVLRALERLRVDSGIDRLIISTEPRDHLKYMLWAASAHISVMVDKPITARDMDPFARDAGDSLIDDYDLAVEAFVANNVRADVLVTRRAHPAYRFVRELLMDFVGEWQVPVTFLGTYHANGYWNMPNELFTRENHPYRYGFGALLHAGYHVVDLAAWLLDANQQLEPFRQATTMELSTRHACAADFIAQVPSPVYRRAFGSAAAPQVLEAELRLEEAQRFGETDVSVLAQFRDSKGFAITQCNIDMRETAFSRRAWFDLPADHYKANGRVTHEEVVVSCGHLLTVRTYDNRRLQRGAEDPPFVVEVYRDSEVIGGKQFERHTFVPAGAERPGQDAASLADDGRRQLLTQWVAGTPGPSLITDHFLTVALIAGSYQSMACQRRGEPPSATVKLRAC